jgi:tRNA acetyltransferase TAN1
MSSSDKGKRKRQYLQSANNKDGHHQKWQPKRGGPAVLLTCDTGRDSKAKREGLQILEYYLHLDKPKHTEDDDCKKDAEEKPLSLDAELAQLQSEHQKAPNSQQQQQQHDYKKKPFAYYDTGCKGTVFLFCMLPDCALIPSIQSAKSNLKKLKDGETNGGDNPSNSPAKKAKIEEDGSTKTSETLAVTPSPLPWDPLATVRRVMHDLDQESSATHHNSNIPGSRFVSRMIPVQATCFASMEEIQLTFRSLLERTVLNKGSLLPSTPTFGIKFKKRNCGSVTRDQVITEIGKQVEEATNKTWKVHLDNPDYRIQIEICKTVCGMSILAASKEDAFMSKHNFNLADLRAQAAAARKGPNMALKTEEPSDKEASAS